MQPASRAEDQVRDSDQELDQSHKDVPAAAHGRGFDGFRFDHAPQELSGALVADFIRLQLQRAIEQALLQTFADAQ
jgi:hypothetical protein